MVMLVLAIACLGGCYQGANYYYMNSEKYTAGDREITEKIDTIFIDYTSGGVQVIRAASDIKGDETAKGDETLSADEASKNNGTIEITETAAKELSESQKVHTWVDGSTLYVKYCASENGIDMRNLNKKLKIEIPADSIFETVNVNVSSADATLENIESKSVVMKASSGSIGVSGTVGNADMTASSGNLTLDLQGESDTLKLEASSGDVAVTAPKAECIRIRTSSGKIKAELGMVEEFDSTSSSGACRVKFDEVPQKTKITASSGNVTVYFPEKPDLKAHVTTSSGKFYYDMAFAKDGKDLISGNGSNYIEVNTSSGDVDFLRN